MLVADDVINADALDVIEHRTVTHRVGNVAGQRLLEGEVGNHVAALLPSRDKPILLIN